MDKIKEIFSKIVAFIKKLLPFVKVEAIQDKAEEKVVEELRRLAAKSDNKVDDRLVEAVAGAINNGSYMTIIKRFGK